MDTSPFGLAAAEARPIYSCSTGVKSRQRRASFCFTLQPRWPCPGGMRMRYRLWLAALLCLAACSSSRSGDTTPLTLYNRDWERVNVEVVYTKSADCDNRGEGYITGKQV